MTNRRSGDRPELDAARRELLRLLLKEKGVAVPQASTIPRRSGDERLPLSFAQQRLWFLHQLAPGTSIYNNPTAVRLRGPLQTEALHQSLQRVVERHEALRTTFAGPQAEDDARPIQLIHARRDLPLTIHDLRDLPLEWREAEARRLAAEEAERPFDLERGPLLRAVLVRLQDHEYLLVLNLHHIISDGWSMGVLLHELLTLYNAASGGSIDAARLGTVGSPLPIQYADYALWQRQRLQGDTLEQQLSYWRQQLADLPILELPTDRPRPAVESFQGAILPVAIPAELTAALTTLSQRAGVTLFQTLLAAFAVLLGRYSGQRDIVVGSPIAGRVQPELRDLIGVFVNMLVLRTDLGGDPSFRELLGRVRATTQDAYAHQELPFEMLVEQLQPQRSLSQTPLFQVVLALQNTPLPELKLHDLDVEYVEIHTRTSKFDLTLNLSESAAGIHGVIEYNTTLFDAATIERLRGHWATLLGAVVADPERRIGRLPLMTAAELEQLRCWNQTARPYPHDRCVHELFEQQAARTPEALAVVADEGRLSYAELNRRANQLAHQLQTLGVGPETAVGLCLNRSLDMIVALYGILKAGGVYVPIDPAWPPERVRWIMASLGLRQVIVRTPQLTLIEQIQAELPALHDIICLDRDDQLPVASPRLWSRADLDRLPDTKPASNVTSANTAYIIYTSGSTGTPKGVIERHQPVVNLIDWVNRTFAVGPGDQQLFVASICFDLSVYDIFGLHAAGGSVRVVAEHDLADPQRLVEILRTEPITFWDSAPAALRQLTSFFPTTPPDAGQQNLRLVFLSGDWIPVTLPDRVRGAFPNAQVIALGGATEATIWSNVYPVGAVDPGWRSIPYGKPIQNAQYYVLDAQLNPCPVGVPGDLYIGGECLADGYSQDPRQTAEKFVPNPFIEAVEPRTKNQEPGTTEQGNNGTEEQRNNGAREQPIASRLYRTGDQARFFADGNIEFLGRRDQQVKIRGYRIELGEIEAVLGQHPAVHERVVVARRDEPIPGEAPSLRLVAYVVMKEPRSKNQEPRDGTDGSRFSVLGSASVSELREFLARRLPEYMLPSAFVQLDALPVTANGKLDRNALPAPDTERPEQEQPYVAPRTANETLLASIWARLLRLERVGIHDNFFSLGGDSILSLQMVNQASQAGLPLTPRQLFQHQTIAELATATGGAPMTLAEQGPVTGPAPLTPIQRWFFSQDLPEPAHWNQALLLHLQAPLPAAQLQAALGMLLRHHDALRLRFRRDDSGWSQTLVAPDDDLPLSLIDLSDLDPPAQPEALAQTAAQLQRSLDLYAGPLLHLAQIDLGAAGARLLIVIHHLATDGVSWRILLDDLHSLSQQLAAGAEPTTLRLPPKTSSFKLWAKRLRDYARSDAVAEQRRFWQALAWQRVVPLPRDLPGGNDEAQTRTLTVALDADATERLLRTLPETYRAQITEILLAALVETLAGWTGHTALLVDLESHGRQPLFDDLDLARTVGWFTAIFPLLLDLDAARTPGVVLRAVKEQLRAIPQHGIGYGLLRWAGDAATQAAFAALPRAEIAFNYLGQIEQALPADGPFRIAGESSGPARHQGGQRSYLLEINALVLDGSLQIDWSYSAAQYQPATIAGLAEDMLQALRAMLDGEHAASTDSLSPSDFPLTGLDQQQLDRVLSRLALDDDSEE